MKIYSLTGSSGTGKSYQAVNLCKELNIESIIDDGLFICRNKVVAGISAKRQKTKLGAVQTAVFYKDEHRDDVKAAIERIKPSSLLVLGTSDKMVDIILERLGLGKPIKRIYIEDISTEDDRKEAHRQRHEFGKHVIPVPTFQLRRQFSGYFVSPMRIIKNFGRWNDMSEKSVVRPAFSYMGKYNIAEKVLTDIIECVKDELGTIAEVEKVSIIKDRTEIDEGLDISAVVDLKWGPGLQAAAVELQSQIAEKIQAMTAFHINRVDLEVRDVVKDVSVAAEAQAE